MAPMMDYRDCYWTSDHEFHTKLQQVYLKTGLEGDTLPYMIQRNVPLYMLQTCWPAKLATIPDHQTRISYCAAETGWKGRISNIQSTLQTSGAKAQLDFHKSHVLDCDHMIVVCRSGPENIALVSLEDMQSIEFQTRDDPGLSFINSKNQIIHHNYAQASLQIAKHDYIELSEKDYSRATSHIAVLESSSLACLAMSVLKRNELEISRNTKMDLEMLLKERNNLSKSRRVLATSRRILKNFYEQCHTHAIKLHPFWYLAQRLFRA